MQKILIVEDDIDIQDILKNHLIDAGYEVVVASDGVAGIAMFDDTIDLLLLDIMLPKIDGYGVCEVIRKRSQVPIIMLTALSDEENQLRGFEQQIDDYIPKPFSPKILLCKIAAILRRRTTENQNPSLLIAVLKRAAIIFRKRGLIYEEQKNFGNRLVRCNLFKHCRGYLCKRIGFGHTKGFNIRNGKHIQRRYSLSGYRRWTNQH